MSDLTHTFPPNLVPLIEEFIPICKKLAEGRYAISIGGSQGKGTWDNRSDVDFRLFCDNDVPWMDTAPELWKDYLNAAARWEKQGVIIDGIWTRKINAIDATLKRWLAGELIPEDLIWTIWGYHLLPDIYHQAVIEDPFDVIGDWKRRLRHYPPSLKKAVLDKHLASVRYWRNDYHYRNKVHRGDIVFLAGLSTKLVHDILQILFALNETYYVGDGQNLHFAEKFAIKPDHLAERVKEILYPSPSNDPFAQQRDRLASLIDEVVRLADETAMSSAPHTA